MTRIAKHHHLGRVTVTGLLAELESVANSLTEKQRAAAFGHLLTNLMSQTGTPFRQHVPKAGLYHAVKNAIESVQ